MSRADDWRLPLRDNLKRFQKNWRFPRAQVLTRIQELRTKRTQLTPTRLLLCIILSATQRPNKTVHITFDFDKVSRNNWSKITNQSIEGGLEPISHGLGVIAAAADKSSLLESPNPLVVPTNNIAAVAPKSSGHYHLALTGGSLPTSKRVKPTKARPVWTMNPGGLRGPELRQRRDAKSESEGWSVNRGHQGNPHFRVDKLSSEAFDMRRKWEP